MKTDFENCIQFALEDFESKINNIQVTENKLNLLFEREIKKQLIKETTKWFILGGIVGGIIQMVINYFR